MYTNLFHESLRKSPDPLGGELFDTVDLGDFLLTTESGDVGL